MNALVIDRLAQEWAAISDFLATLTPAEWETPTDLPGWRVLDVVSHMIGTEKMLAGDPSPEAPQQMGSHVLNPIGELNEAWVAERADWSPTKVHAEFNDITKRRLEQLQAMTKADFEAEGFTPEGPGPYRKFMEIRLFDCWEHEQDIRRAVQKPGHLIGPIAEFCIDKVITSAGYVVGKKAAAPQGSKVVFDIPAPITRAFSIVVDGRAQYVGEPVADPTVTLRMDSDTYNQLGCGRINGDAARASGRVAVIGDEDLGNRILDNMAFTI